MYRLLKGKMSGSNRSCGTNPKGLLCGRWNLPEFRSPPKDVQVAHESKDAQVAHEPKDDQVAHESFCEPGLLCERGNLPQFRSPPKDAQVAHGSLLPQEIVDAIPQSDLCVLRFVQEFLAQEDLPEIPVLVVGGYVRDLLLDRVPDDLDLSFVLRALSAEYTVEGIFAGMHQFAETHPELGVVSVEFHSIKSDQTKNKMLDTAKAHFRLINGKIIEVDFMPTIGEEIYGESSRTPERNERGTPKEDAGRRDLTVGALMLEVHQHCGKLRFKLLDFYGGLADLLPGDNSPGLLRCPAPLDITSSELTKQVLRNHADRALAARLGIVIAGNTEADPDQEADACQTLAWIRILRDDPLRILRVLRFKAKLGFMIHPSFWKALPFALESLRAKVAGSRKLAEVMKVAKISDKALIEMIRSVFNSSELSREWCLASALFGGKSDKKFGYPREVQAFDCVAFDRLMQCLPRETSRRQHAAEERLAECLAVAFMCSRVSLSCSEGSPGKNCTVEEDRVLVMGSLTDFEASCKGLGASNVMRNTGHFILNAVKLLQEHADQEPEAHHKVLAQQCGVTPSDMVRHLWTLKVLFSLKGLILPKGWVLRKPEDEQNVPPEDVERVQLQLKLLRERGDLVIELLRLDSHDLAEAVKSSVTSLKRPLPTRFSGSCFRDGEKGYVLFGGKNVHKRMLGGHGGLVACFEVFYRLHDPKPTLAQDLSDPIEEPEQFDAFMGTEPEDMQLHEDLVHGLLEVIPTKETI